MPSTAALASSRVVPTSLRRDARLLASTKPATIGRSSASGVSRPRWTAAQETRVRVIDLFTKENGLADGSVGAPSYIQALTVGPSGKIWQKIMILDTIAAPLEPSR